LTNSSSANATNTALEALSCCGPNRKPAEINPLCGIVLCLSFGLVTFFF
jgi:hypothetical protein